MLSWKQDKLLIQAAQGEFLHTLNPNTPFQLEADLIHPPQRKVRYLFLFFFGGVKKGKKIMATSAFHQRNVTWRHLFGIGFLRLPFLHFLPWKSRRSVHVCDALGNPPKPVTNIIRRGPEAHNTGRYATPKSMLQLHLTNTATTSNDILMTTIESRY